MITNQDHADRYRNCSVADIGTFRRKLNRRPEEWELSEADIDEVLRWVDEHGEGRTHSLWVVVRTDREVDLIRLRGSDPPAAAETWPPWAGEAAASLTEDL